MKWEPQRFQSDGPLQTPMQPARGNTPTRSRYVSSAWAQWKNSAEQILFLLRTDGTCVDASLGATKWMGIALQEITGRSLCSLSTREATVSFERGNDAATVPDYLRLLQQAPADEPVCFEIPLTDRHGQRANRVCCGWRCDKRDSASHYLVAVESLSERASRAAGDSPGAEGRADSSSSEFHRRVEREVHELNNLLTALHCECSLQISRTSAPSSRLDDLLKRVSEQSQRLTRLCAEFAPAASPGGESDGHR